MRVKWTVFSVAAALLLIGATSSTADEAERKVYVEEVEPICKKNREANDQILTGVRRLVKAGKLDAAASKFARAAKALKSTRLELARVPKPPDDAKTLTRWLELLKKEAELFEDVSRKLAHGEKTAAQQMIVRLVTNAKRANEQVLEFRFRYCQLPISNYI